MTFKKIKLFLIAGLIITSASAADTPKNFSISYKYKNPDGSVFRIIKYYMSEGLKFRSEYFIMNQYQIDAEVKAEKSDKTDANVKAEMKKENLTDTEAQIIEILRKDKELVWSLEPSLKLYREVPLKQDGWEHAFSQIFIYDSIKINKTGEIKVLGYPCEVYEYTQNFSEDKWTNIFYVAKDMEVILKSEMLKNGKLVQLQEATEFSIDKPADNVFEVPDGFNKAVDN